MDNLNTQNQQMPEPGTPEYDLLMEQHYGLQYLQDIRVGFGLRFAAFFFDILIFIVLMVIGFVLIDIMSFVDLIPPDLLTDSVALTTYITDNPDKFAPFVMKISIIYYGAFLAVNLSEIFLAGSIGKLIMKIRIANQDRTKADFKKLAIRFSIKYSFIILSFLSTVLAVEALGSISVLLWFLWAISALFTLAADKLSLYDKIAKTAVYELEQIKK